MDIQTLKSKLPDVAKDIRLNIEQVLSEEGSPGLAQRDIWMAALASAYATKHQETIAAIGALAAQNLSEAELTAARGATALMAMNNIYYRFLHLTSDPEFRTMRAGLRMNLLKDHGVDKVAFEVASLAVSVINGCDMCVDAHVKEIVKEGVTKQGVQSVARIAAVIHAVAQSLVLADAQ